MVIYIDIIWSLNFLFDCLLLYLTAIILKREFKFRRIVFGGFLGSVIILLMITPLNAYSNHPITKLFFSVMMVIVTFGFKRPRYFLKNLITFYFITFLIGGALIGTHYFIKFDSELSSNLSLASIKGFGDPISWIFVMLGFPIAWHFSKTNIENFEMTKIQYDQMIQVKIQIEENTFLVKGLIDSGNGLYDPISRSPVMLVSIKNIQQEIPQHIIEIAEHPNDFIMGEKSIPPTLEERIRIIPYSVVGQEHQLIIAIKPEKLVLEINNEEIVVEKALVSFTWQQLSADDAFQCIVHPKMVTGKKSIKQNTKVS